jgi:hypothetical protein
MAIKRGASQVRRPAAGIQRDEGLSSGFEIRIGMAASKFAGLCSLLFHEGMWPTQTASNTGGDAFDEVVVEPSNRSIEKEVDALLATDQATRVDATAAEHLLRIIRAAELMGTRAIISGVSPAVAQTITSTRVDLSGIITVGNLQQGLELCMRSLGGRPLPPS